MHSLWSFIAGVYSDLIYAGLWNKPPTWLFNQPKKQLQCAYDGIIWGDVSFSEYERKVILQAVKDLEYFCNGLIKLEIVFNLDPNDIETINNDCVLLKEDSNNPSIQKADGYYQSKVLGLCDYMEAGNRRLYLVHDRLLDYHVYRTTAIHELGHFISMWHTPAPSIMHKNNNNNVLYPTYNDAKELADVWLCPIEMLRYFRLK